MNAQQLLTETDLTILAFPVEKQAVYVANTDEEYESLEDYRAIRRLDTGETLSIVSKHYRLVPHNEVIVPLIEKLGAEWQVRKVYLENGGGKAYVRLMNQDVAHAIGTEPIKPLLTIANSYDRTTSFRVTYQALFREHNLAVPIEGIPALKMRSVHMGGFDSRWNNLKDNLELFKANFSTLIDQYHSLMPKKVSRETAEDIAKEIVGERKAERVLWYWTNGRNQTGEETAWTLYLGFTEYLTHDFTGAYSRAEDMNKKALETLLEL